MAPSKVLTGQPKPTAISGVVTRRGLATRQNKEFIPDPSQKQNLFKDTRIKRKADASPTKDKVTKRSALGNITNAIGKTITQIQDAKKVAKKVTSQPVKPLTQTTANTRTLDKIVTSKQENIPQSKPKQSVTRAKPQLKKEEEKTEIPAPVIKALNAVRRSIEVEKSDESSLYVSALESLPEESKRLSRTSKDSAKLEAVVKPNNALNQEPEGEKSGPSDRINRNPCPVRKLPPGVSWDLDAENWADHFQVPQYAMDIFEYLKNREKLFVITDYMERQVCLSKWMRSLLVDWMVAVQESFELNHETLYLAVKLVDLYLTKVTVGKETLQLLGAASLFIASKFDERIPPMIEDFLYICDGAYTHRELTRMEINVLKVMDFDLGIPLSYRFLRRYARCAKVSMPTLTLARYILEYSLMDYATISFSDSKMAAAALFLALQMKDLGTWTTTLEYYTGYKLKDFADIVNVLNEGLHRKQKEALSTVRNKYSHKIFFEVAKVALKDKLEM
ncbi:G2/mitotic-specific cyclin-B3 [Trichogramma pretiosum]|uniref:G2/mitotic-specific cyclin-B3 n=1 Tax=Trichogramma pretiosum TaxID=7493 RepID=UPI0006C96174|nr:G2/mitotic-specific cyclin-B3 [Trichogramma pretiosum]XP_014237798.1 G2/mitotic-specific cyclin-B3 [Trichogramma pretiosum]XP_014237799.1 G2/mitotic-specific cyclin-B3 [Trichogramma pretiosum]XP_014237800.1 G2/mitotic-specific cyclin-B3 [Trichogramma pretiosum]XP_014237801.1 G2/mitotic-specific cyclin-B3 [Trichogramma pretiosum]